MAQVQQVSFNSLGHSSANGANIFIAVALLFLQVFGNLEWKVR